MCAHAFLKTGPFKHLLDLLIILEVNDQFFLFQNTLFIFRQERNINV